MIHHRLLVILLVAVLLTAQSPQPYVYYLPVIVKSPYPLPRKGLAVYGPYASTGCLDAGNVYAAWWYNWWDHPNGECDTGFVPMLYDDRMLNYQWHITYLLRYGAESGWILGYNEPNLAWQGNVSPLYGAIGWHRLEELVQGTDIKLVSPAPSQHHPGELDPYGYAWLLAMVREYQRLYGSLPRFDAIAWHYYGNSTDTKNFLIARHNDFAVLYPETPVWLTEFNNCVLGNRNYNNHMQDLIPWLNSTDWISRYFYFINRPTPDFPETYSPCTLMDVNGNLTSAGLLYRTY